MGSEFSIIEMGLFKLQGEFNVFKRIGTLEFADFVDSKPWKIRQYDISGNNIGKWIEYNKNGDIICSFFK